MNRESPKRGRGWLRNLLRHTPDAGSLDPASLFKRFKAVLSGNNRALEMITDLGDKLGGEYLFDVNYTKAAYGELYSAISSSLENFNILTGNNYPVLTEVLARIDRRIQQVLTNEVPESEPLVVFYPEITWDLAELVGGKNYNLALLGNDLNLNTPSSFAVTAQAFDVFMAHNHLTDTLLSLADHSDQKGALADIRRDVLAGEIPPELEKEFDRAAHKLAGRHGAKFLLAVRSSAEEEDGDFSFAGQFESVLNVPAVGTAVGRAWQQVVASLFTERAVSYQRQLGYEPGRLRMAAACVSMITAKISGVIYTVAGPGQDDTIMINAAWGLGPAVVDGITDADLYLVKKGEEPVIEKIRPGRKELMVVSGGPEGIQTVDTPEEKRSRTCLNEKQILELARQAQRIEEYFRTTQDIEWAMDEKGKIFFLQSRTLKVDELEKPLDQTSTEVSEPDLPVLMKNQGVVIKRGTTAGKVFVVHNPKELDKVPHGAVLVAHHDSPHYVRVIPFVNAIITDTGVATSHMASICREFAIPTVVNTGNATELLSEGREITLRAEGDGEITVYAGVARNLLRQERKSSGKLRQLYEFRRQKFLMHYIAPLHLVNPLEEEFTAKKCRSVHDMIRFMHEMSVQALVAGAAKQAGSLTGRLFGRKSALHNLTLPIPIRMLVIDIGDALMNGNSEVTMEELRSRPLKAILAGILAPGAWREESMPLTGRDFLAGMTRGTDLQNTSAAAGSNLAVASAEYVNLSLRFGFHFNMLDSYCTDNPRNNHIYFRFVGGAAAITSRSLRIHFMAKVMSGYGFAIKTKGDLLVARISNLPAEEVERLLTGLGRLIGFARQLDAVMTTEEAADKLAADFLEGKTSSD